MAQTAPLPKTPQAPKTEQQKGQPTQPGGDHEPKILLAEAIFVGLFIFGVDVVEMIPVVNILVGDIPLTDILAFPATQIYLRMKGVRGTYQFFGNALEVIPVVGWFPLRTAGFVITVIADHYPTLTKLAKRGVTSTTGAAKGGGAPTSTKEGQYVVRWARAGTKEVPEIQAKNEAAVAESRARLEKQRLQPMGKEGGALGAPSTPFEEMERPMREVPELQRIGEEPSPQERKAKEQASEEALGAGKSEFEKMREPMEKVPTIDELKPKKKESDDQRDLPLAA